MSEILVLCGSNKAAVIASLNILDDETAGAAKALEDEVIAKSLGGLSVESVSQLQKVLRVHKCASRSSAIQMLEALIPVYRSRLGALLFLISTLLSRGLEIVNLLLSESAVANVFDGNMDWGDSMFVKGISNTVEVGFLTLLEPLNYCKVGKYLKCPNWPIWVVGSESHYTVLFALDTKGQEENELETQRRRFTELLRLTIKVGVVAS